MIFDNLEIIRDEETFEYLAFDHDNEITISVQLNLLCKRKKY